MGDSGPIKAHSGTGAVLQKLSRLVIPLILIVVAVHVQYRFLVTGERSGRSPLLGLGGQDAGRNEANESRFIVL